jgi:hypothetical protein
MSASQMYVQMSIQPEKGMNADKSAPFHHGQNEATQKTSTNPTNHDPNDQIDQREYAQHHLTVLKIKN